MDYNRIKHRRLFLVSILLAAMLLCGHASAAEPVAPDEDTVLYKSYPYGNFAADALRDAGETDVALIDNGTVYTPVAG